MRIAILGSCVSRDCFPEAEAGIDICYYSARTSHATRVLPPVPAELPKHEIDFSISSFEYRCIAEDFQKNSLDRLKAAQPDLIILDFIDERFQLYHSGGSIFSGSNAFLKLRDRIVFSEAPKQVLSSDLDQMWKEGFGKLAQALMDSNLSDRVVLHSARWAVRSRRMDGTSGELPQDRLEKAIYFNKKIDEMETIAKEQLRGLRVLAAPSELRVAAENHRWGFAPFHFVDEYYEHIAAQLS